MNYLHLFGHFASLVYTVRVYLCIDSLSVVYIHKYLMQVFRGEFKLVQLFNMFDCPDICGSNIYSLSLGSR